MFSFSNKKIVGLKNSPYYTTGPMNTEGLCINYDAKDEVFFIPYCSHEDVLETVKNTWVIQINHLNLRFKAFFVKIGSLSVIFCVIPKSVFIPYMEGTEILCTLYSFLKYDESIKITLPIDKIICHVSPHIKYASVENFPFFNELLECYQKKEYQTKVYTNIFGESVFIDRSSSEN